MIAFDADAVRTVEFGVVRRRSADAEFAFVPTGDDVQVTLTSMATRTVDALRQRSDTRAQFDAAEKHANTEYLIAPIDDEIAAPLRDLHLAENLDADSHVLDDMSSVSAYFARVTDSSARKITAVRRANQFKGVKSRRMMRVVDDSLQMVNQPIFQLNDDFDVIVDDEAVHILHPSGFRALAQVEEAVRNAVGRNIASISNNIPYIEWSPVQEYAETHPRAAGLLSSIRTHRFAENIDQGLLLALCRGTRVGTSFVNGSVVVTSKDIMGFLEVLDRRRYEIGLVRAAPEQFRAASRQRLSK